jgi:hypothetical protein
MTRVEYMELAISTFMGAKKVSAQHIQSHHMAIKLGMKLDEAGLLLHIDKDGKEIGSLPDHADFVVKTAINIMCSDTGDFNQENSSLSKAIEALEYYLNPKKTELQKSLNGGIAVDNPSNLPVYGPGGALQISGIPQMPSWPSGSCAPTYGVIGDSAIAQIK